MGTGTTSLVLIFTVMMLVVFAVLALTSAQAGWRMTQRMAERTGNYYQAQNHAVETLARVERLAEKIRRKYSEEAFAAKLQEAVEDGAAGDDVTWQDGRICWEVEVTEKQKLSVAVRPITEEECSSDAAKSGGGFVTEVWQLLEVKAAGQGSQKLNLYVAEPQESESW